MHTYIYTYIHTPPKKKKKNPKEKLMQKRGKKKKKNYGLEQSHQCWDPLELTVSAFCHPTILPAAPPVT